MGLLVAIVLSVFVVGWLARSDVDRLELGTPAAVLVVNLAGPVEVLEGDGPVVVEAAVSYLVARPSVDTASGAERGVVRASCPDWVPCRVALTVQVPPGTPVEVISPHDMVSVGAFTGPLRIVSDDGRVALGPVSGPLDVTVGSAPVRATDVRSGEVRIEAVSGPVEVVARAVPRELTVRARSSPVTVSVPEARYRLDLRGDPVDQGDLVTSRRADGAVTIDTDGSVRLALSPPDEG